MAEVKNSAAFSRALAELAQRAMPEASKEALEQIRSKIDAKRLEKLQEHIQEGYSRMTEQAKLIREYRRKEKASKKEIARVEELIMILLNPEHEDHDLVSDNWDAAMIYTMEHLRSRYGA